MAANAHLLRRNRAIAARFYQLDVVEHRKSTYIWATLVREFYLAEDTLKKIVRETPYIPELNESAERPAGGDR